MFFNLYTMNIIQFNVLGIINNLLLLLILKEQKKEQKDCSVGHKHCTSNPEVAYMQINLLTKESALLMCNMSLAFKNLTTQLSN